MKDIASHRQVLGALGSFTLGSKQRQCKPNDSQRQHIDRVENLIRIVLGSGPQCHFTINLKIAMCIIAT